MIGEDGKGKLNDWDLSRSVDTKESLETPRTVRVVPHMEATLFTRVFKGTWQFMSTRLLTIPGSQHEITDDLESHFFVLMWVALHSVEHNRTTGDERINMEYIFDQQWQNFDGIVRGGAGKTQMYLTEDALLLGVGFACKPFNDLFWGLWNLFSNYNISRSLAHKRREPGERSTMQLTLLLLTLKSEPSVSPREMIDMFKRALEQPGWIDDKVVDQYPTPGSKTISGWLFLRDNGASRVLPTHGKKRGPVRSIMPDKEEVAVKRRRGAENILNP